MVVFANDNGGPVGPKTCNYPLSGAKSNHLEGGIRVPCILKLPNTIEAGKQYHAPISMLDLLPTFVEAARGEPKKIEGIDGVNLLPFITKKTSQIPHEVLYWKKENRAAVRKGDWKLLRFPDRPAELYNLTQDIGEQNNLASNYPEKVKELFTELWDWECQLERPIWMLKRKYEDTALKRMDEFRSPKLD